MRWFYTMPQGTSNNSKLKIAISEVMTSSVFTIFPDQTVEEAAKLMFDNSVGCVILQPKLGEKVPLGIITERDIITRVVAQGKNPTTTLVDEIATRPVITAPPNLDITDAMKLMSRLNIRRLIIVENNIVKGICTYRDLLRIAPSLIEVAMEYEKIGLGNDSEFEHELSEEDDYDSNSDYNTHNLSLGFYCSQCGEWCDESPHYYNETDQPVCGDCYSLEENE